MTSFSFTVPGQPVSWNAAYQVRRYKLPNGEWQRGIRKTKEAEAYQDGVRMIARVARPSSFMVSKTQQLIVAYEFFLKKDIDCDNLLKLMNDALAEAINVNDRVFLPVVMSKSTGLPNPYTRITVYDASAWRVVLLD